ncbi:MAG: serine hydrolase [Saprospiraceae bacterium]
MTLKFKIFLLGLFVLHLNTFAQPININQRLQGIDPVIEKILKDWNVPGCGIGIVQKDKLVFAKGYGYRNIEKKLPVTSNTLFQIASNTKLFTATSIGFLVEEGKLAWDVPIKNFIPQIQFYNDALNANVTIRDMLSHRTGISRHDNIWYKSDFSRQELFDRIKFLEPSIPLRQGYLYNNLMYAAAGAIIEILSKQTWEDYVRNKIFNPLGMTHSMFITEEMLKQVDFMSPYFEKRDTNLLAPFPYYTKMQGVGPCGSIISSIDDLSHWLIAQMNSGVYNNQAIIAPSVIKETMTPAIPTSSVPDKYFESLNGLYGMGRATSAYKGHYRVQHGGAIGGIYSQISMMPSDSIGIIVFTNGAHVSYLPGIIANTVYDKLLNLDVTPWSDRALKDYLKDKITDKEARKKPDVDRVMNTKPSHPLADYTGIYEDPAYGKIEIKKSGDGLSFDYNHTALPLSHYHYDRFVSADDEIDGKWSLSFTTDAQGSISQVRISMDEKEVIFNKKADAKLYDPGFLKTLVGKYELNGNTIDIVLNNGSLMIQSAPPQHLDPNKNNSFRIREFSDQVIEFVPGSSSTITGLKIIYDGKEVFYKRK